MLEELRQQVCDANRRLVDEHLVTGTFGNASGIDADGAHVVIKPSGVPYDGMTAEQMVVVSLSDGATVAGDLQPSCDTPTHLELYRAFESVRGVVHTHSLYATAWAQGRRPLPALGTTHADWFGGPVPVTRQLRPDEIAGDYEAAVGKVIVERFLTLDPARVPAALVAGHGPFVWGASPGDAVRNAAALEHLARLASETLRVEPYPPPLCDELLEKHFARKHGPGATYGQK